MKSSSSKPEPLRKTKFSVRKIMKHRDLTFVNDLLSFHSRSRDFNRSVSHYLFCFQNIKSVNKEHAIACISSKRRYTFITGAIIILLKTLKECNFLIEIWTYFSKAILTQIVKKKQEGILKYFFALLDKKVFCIPFFQIINKNSYKVADLCEQ